MPHPLPSNFSESGRNNDSNTDTSQTKPISISNVPPLSPSINPKEIAAILHQLRLSHHNHHFLTGDLIELIPDPEYKPEERTIGIVVEEICSSQLWVERYGNNYKSGGKSLNAPADGWQYWYGIAFVNACLKKIRGCVGDGSEKKSVETLKTLFYGVAREMFIDENPMVQKKLKLHDSESGNLVVGYTSTSKDLEQSLFTELENHLSQVSILASVSYPRKNFDWGEEVYHFDSNDKFDASTSTSSAESDLNLKSLIAFDWGRYCYGVYERIGIMDRGFLEEIMGEELFVDYRWYKNLI